MPWPFIAAAFGAIVGSFLNVVIYRYPREESVVFPPSRCPHCGKQIRPWDNVPVLAWLWLGGKCRDCKGPISVRYPLIELANALLYVAVFQRTGLSIGFVPIAAIVSMLIVLIFIDLEIQILPDVVDLPGTAIGLAIGAMGLGALHPDLTLSTSIVDSLIGAAAGSGVLLLIAVAYRVFRKIEGMGLGDVKMMAMLGAVFGWEPLFPLLLVASASGAVVGVALIFRSGKTMVQLALPFGVFLGLAAIVMLFWGRELQHILLPIV
jgi:leader peptidase (prepilin peptidase)/N-methyltransferase